MIRSYISPAKIKLGVLIFLLFLMALVSGLQLLGLYCPMELVSSAEDSPVVTDQEPGILFTGITQVAADENHLYVLYGKHSLVQVYSRDGVYQHTIAVYNHPNGRTEIAVRDGNLYICDRISNVYTFRNGELTAYTDRSESLELRRGLPLGLSDPDYTVRAGSVWNTAEDRCIIERPAWLVVYQNDFLTMCLLFLVGLLAYLTVIPGMRGKR